MRIDSCAAAQDSVGKKGAAADDVPDDVSGTQEGDCLGECGGDIVVWRSNSRDVCRGPSGVWLLM